MYIPLNLKPYWWYKYYEFPQKVDILNFISKCIKTNGGIANTPNGQEYLETTFYAIVLISLLDSLNLFTNQTIAYIKEKENIDGGFGETSANLPNLFNTFYAIVCLSVFNEITPQIRKKTFEYLNNSIIHNDGIYDRHHCKMSTTSSYWTLIIMKCIMWDDFKIKDQLISFCMECYNKENGLFSPYPNEIPTIQNTFEAIIILKELSALSLIEAKKTTASILERKYNVNFYDNLLNKYTLSSTMWALSIMNILNTLDRVQNSDILFVINQAINTPGSIYNLFCIINILVNMTYNYGQVYTINTYALTETGNYDYSEIKHVDNKLEKSGINKGEYDYSYILKKYVSGFNFNNEDGYLQIILDKNSNRFYEIEYSDQKILSLKKAISRVGKECITKRVLDNKKVKILGIFNPTRDLLHSDEEFEIMQNYCQNNSFIHHVFLKGENATSDNIMSNIAQGYHIFYFSGHSHDGYLFFSDKKVLISSILWELINNQCAIVIFNSCNTYKHIKEFFLSNIFVSEILNVVCAINDINDELAKIFLIKFLYYFELGFPISEAIRNSKKDVYVKSNGLGETWWSYILFGNPYTVIA
jgi:prenyltransferase beta subunit